MKWATISLSGLHKEGLRKHRLTTFAAHIASLEFAL